MDIPTLRTARLTLRAFREGDANLLAGMMADPETVRYFPFSRPPSAEQVHRLVDRQDSHWRKHGYGWWAVEQAGSAEFTGWCGLQYLPDTEEIEVAYLIAKAHWGKGLATEAAAVALRYAFGPLDLETVVGIVHPDNVGSRRVLEKLGGGSGVKDRYFDMDCVRYVVRREAFAVSPYSDEKPECPDVQAHPPTAGLEEAVAKSLEHAEHGKALVAADALAEALGEHHSDTLYRAARLAALIGRRESAYDYLDSAVAAGFWDVERLQSDAAFLHLRGEEAFRALARLAWTKGYVWMLDRSEREEFQKPDAVMEALALREGERVAEIGPGSGYFTLRVARAVGPEGVVHALDVSQEMLDHLAKRLRVAELTNVVPARITRDDPKLPDYGVETVLMVDMLHYVADRAGYAAKLRQGLKDGARVAIIDYRPKPWEDRPWGPPPEQQVPAEAIASEMQSAGFVLAESHDFLPEQYFLVFRTA